MQRSVLLAAVLCFLLLGLAVPARASQSTASSADVPAVTARLGISADTLADAPLGTTGEVLQARIPLLWNTAERLSVSIMSASVGQGFWSEEGQLGREKDLDLVVTGRQDAIERLAGTLGLAWGQSTVYVWYPRQDGGQQTTATIPLTGGANQLSDDVYQAIVVQITGGAHVKYAGSDSLIFIAKTDATEPDDAFSYRMTRLAEILTAAGVQTGPIQYGRADVTVETRDNYQQYVSQRVADAAA